MKLKELLDRAARFALASSTTTYDAETMMQISMRLALAVKAIRVSHAEDLPKICRCGSLLSKCQAYKTLRAVEDSE